MPQTKRDESKDTSALVSRLLDSAQITSLPTWAMKLFLEAGEALMNEQNKHFERGYKAGLEAGKPAAVYHG